MTRAADLRSLAERVMAALALLAAGMLAHAEDDDGK